MYIILNLTYGLDAVDVVRTNYGNPVFFESVEEIEYYAEEELGLSHYKPVLLYE